MTVQGFRVVSLKNRCNDAATYTAYSCVYVPGAQGKIRTHTRRAGHTRNVVCIYMRGIVRYSGIMCCVCMCRALTVLITASMYCTVLLLCVCVQRFCAQWILFCYTLVTPVLLGVF